MKYIIACLAVFGLLLCVVYLVRSSPQDVLQPTHTKRQENICGQYCLNAVLQHLGKNVELPELLHTVPVGRGTNLAHLKQLAQAYELQALGARVPVDVLFSMRCPAILHVNGNHFIALLPDGAENSFTVVDPPRSFAVTAPKDLTSRWQWQGNCLFIDDEEIRLPGTETTQGVPRIFVENPVYDAGIVFDDTTIISPTYKITNKGTAELLIKEIKTDCSCTTAAVERKKLRPGEFVDLTVKFHVKGRFGRLAERKTLIITNDPKSPETVLSIKAERRREFALDPRLASLGLVRMGTDKVLLMRIIPGAEDKELLTEKAETSSTFVEVTQVKSEFATRSPNEYLLKIHLLPTAPAGSFSALVRIPCMGASRRTLEIPISAEIVGAIRTSLSKLQFGLISPGEGPRTKKINLRSDKGFDIVNISADQAWLEVEKEKLNPGGYSLIVRLIPAAAAGGRLEATVVAETTLPDMKFIKIPVFAYRL